MFVYYFFIYAFFLVFSACVKLFCSNYVMRARWAKRGAMCNLEHKNSKLCRMWMSYCACTCFRVYFYFDGTAFFYRPRCGARFLKHRRGLYLCFYEGHIFASRDTVSFASAGNHLEVLSRRRRTGRLVQQTHRFGEGTRPYRPLFTRQVEVTSVLIVQAKGCFRGLGP